MNSFQVEKGADGNVKSLPKEVSIIGQPDVEKEKLKTKASSGVTRRSEDLKERRKSGEGIALTSEKKTAIKTPKESKKEITKDTKAKENKDKVSKQKKLC